MFKFIILVSILVFSVDLTQGAQIEVIESFTPNITANLQIFSRKTRSLFEEVGRQFILVPSPNSVSTGTNFDNNALGFQLHFANIFSLIQLFFVNILSMFGINLGGTSTSDTTTTTTTTAATTSKIIIILFFDFSL